MTARKAVASTTCPQCLDTKAISVRNAVRELGQLALEIGEELQAYKLADLTDFSMEELTRFYKDIGWARSNLKHCRIMAREGVERHKRGKKTPPLRQSRRGVNGSKRG